VRLRQELLRIRRATEIFGACLRVDRHWVEIQTERLTTDLDAFEDYVKLASHTVDPVERANQLTSAVAVINGVFLAGLQDPWVIAFRRTYSEKVRRVWLDLAETRLATGDYSRALEAANGAVQHNPLDVGSNTTLIKCLIDCGQRAKAHEAFLEFDALMLRELGRNAPTSARAPLDLKLDIEVESLDPTQIGQAGVIRPLPLFGREDLLEQLNASMSRKGSIVSVVGMVGVGKTHLIQEFAWRFCELTQLPVQMGGDPKPISDGLFVIDGLTDRSSLEDLVSRANVRGWRVLVESRTRLLSDLFYEIPVNVLPTPSRFDSMEAVFSNASVQLLISQISKESRALSDVSDAQDLGEIARRLDGLPQVLRALSHCFVVETPNQVLQTLERRFPILITQSDENGDSITSAIRDAVSALASPVIDSLVALSFLDGASLELATTISGQTASLDAWHQLEQRCLISANGSGTQRRLRVPNPVAIAIRNFETAERIEALQASTWKTLADWAYKHSRELVGPNQDHSFAILFNELESLRCGIRWAITHDPALAAYLAVSSWRVICSRGNPSLDGDLLHQAASGGAHLLSPVLGGEAWTGTAVAISICGQLDAAEVAFLRAIEQFGSEYASDSLACRGWAQLNYAVCVLTYKDIHRSIDTLNSVADEAINPALRTLALTDHALAHASIGVVGDSFRYAERIFAERLQSECLTTQARGYVNLGELYQVAGRTEAARPLIEEGIRKLRKAGIQYMLQDQLIYLAELTMADEDPDWLRVRDLLSEANELAARMGARMKQVKIARLLMTLQSRAADRRALLDSIERAFHLVQTSESTVERERCLRALAVELKHHDRHEYSEAISASLGQAIDGQCHEGWRTLLSTDSHATICVLAVMLAKEAIPVVGV